VCRGEGISTRNQHTRRKKRNTEGVDTARVSSLVFDPQTENMRSIKGKWQNAMKENLAKRRVGPE
jgi:hypothetical protein